MTENLKEKLKELVKIYASMAAKSREIQIDSIMNSIVKLCRNDVFYYMRIWCSRLYSGKLEKNRANVGSVGTYVADAGRLLEGYSARLFSLQEKEVVVDEQTLLSELTNVCEMFPRCTVKTRSVAGDTLRVPMGRIYLEGEYLGKFAVEICFSKVATTMTPEDTIRIQVSDQQSQYSSYPHPHIEGSHLCMGPTHLVVRRRILENKWVDVCLLLKNLLNSYSPDQAYKTLEYLLGHEGDGDYDEYMNCYCCGNEIPEDDTRVCEECGECLCEDCIAICPTCNWGLCASHLNSKCSSCGASMCGQCAMICECGNARCPACSTAGLVCKGSSVQSTIKGGTLTDEQKATLRSLPPLWLLDVESGEEG